MITGSHYQGVLGGYDYKYIGKAEKNVQQIKLDKHKPFYNIDPIDRDYTIQFNSTFLELVDKAYYFRGWVVIMQMLGLSILLIATIWVFKLAFLGRMGFEWVTFCLGLFGLAGFSVIAYFLRLEGSFSYQYYPMRFNRKSRKVYVFKNKDTIETYDWDTLKVAITNLGIENYCDIRLYETDKKGKITRAFSLPFMTSLRMEKNEKTKKWESEDTGTICDFISQWEYVRQYMEGEDLTPAHSAIRYKLSLHKNRRSLKEMARVAWLWWPTQYDYVKKADKWEINLQRSYSLNCTIGAIKGFASLMVLKAFLGNLLLSFIAKRPVWPQWVEQDSVIDANDPFDYDKHPNQGHEKAKPTALGIFLRILTIVFIYAGLFLCVWGTEAMMEAKSGEPLEFSLLYYMSFWRWF